MWTHWLAILPITTNILKRQFHKVWTIGAVFMTSVNHWRKPMNSGFRHNLDVCTVFVVGTYNIYRQPKIWIPVNTVCLYIWHISRKYRKRWVHSFLHIIPVGVYLLEDYLYIQ